MHVSIRSFLIIALFASSGFAQDIKVRGTIVDSDTGKPVAARIYIQGADGKWYFPKSDDATGTAFEYKRQAGTSSIEQHVTLSAHPFVVDLPPGKYTFLVERGKEYLPFEKVIEISKSQESIQIPIRRWTNMVSHGWYSGDVHAHRPLAEMPNLVMAEDLNVAMPLSHWVTASETSPVSGNRVKDPAPKAEWIPVDATHGIYPLNTEYEIFTVGGKSHTLGAVLICGQKSVIDQGVPPVRRIAERAHAEGAFLDLEKHSWAWSPMIVPLMKVDLFELANNHCWRTQFGFPAWTVDAAPKSMNLEMTDKGFTEWGWIDFGLKSYYAYLNCGFRMMPSAGTGAGVHPVPFGFGRVYVHVPGDFTYEKWRTNLLAGRSFVTTGPLMRMTFNDADAGETFRVTGDSTTVKVSGVIESVSKLGRVEILRDGDVVWTGSFVDLKPRDGVYSVKINQEISFERSGWMVVRCFESHEDKRVRFAHTAPVFVEIPNKPAIPRKFEVEHFVDRIEKELARHKGVLNADTIDEYNEALQIYRRLLPISR